MQQKQERVFFFPSQNFVFKLYEQIIVRYLTINETQLKNGQKMIN